METARIRAGRNATEGFQLNGGANVWPRASSTANRFATSAARGTTRTGRGTRPTLNFLDHLAQIGSCFGRRKQKQIANIGWLEQFKHPRNRGIAGARSEKPTS